MVKYTGSGGPSGARVSHVLLLAFIKGGRGSCDRLSKDHLLLSV